MDRGPRNHFVGHHYLAQHVAGPLTFMNPTKRYLPVPSASKPSSGQLQAAGAPGDELGNAAGASATKAPDGVYHVWRSRDNRKGRHCAVVSPMSAGMTAKGRAPKPTNSMAGTWSGIVKMAVRYPVWDVSYDVATVFTLGWFSAGEPNDAALFLSAWDETGC